MGSCFLILSMKTIRKLLFLSSIALLIFSFYFTGIRNTELSAVEGWGPNTSRNTKDYISEELVPHIISADFCAKKEFLLLVMVHSKPENFAARSAIRATWAKKRANVSFFFIIGELNNPLVQSEIVLESLNFGDVIQERFIDHYNNLTLKSIAMLKLFDLFCADSYKYLMKIDDDVFLNIFLVVRMLSQLKTTSNLLIGGILKNKSPFREASSKWFMPYEMYPEEKYPDYLCGSTYVMSADVAHKLYQCALESPIVHIEDVFLTGICAKKMNLTPEDDHQFPCYSFHKHFCFLRDIYSLHAFSPEDLRRSYRILENNECASHMPWLRWLSYFHLI